MSQIFDSNLNTHLNHEHPEYAYQGDLDTLVQDVNKISSHIKEVDDILYKDIQESSGQVFELQNALQGIVTKLMNSRMNMNNGIFDAGTFENPGDDFSFDGGTF